MGKILKLGLTDADRFVGWALTSGLVLSLGNLPAIAVDAALVVMTIAQGTPTTQVRRPTLKTGSEGVAVSELQAALKLLGYYAGAVDGVYQEGTAIAVSQFQQAAGLAVDGIAGPATWERLFPDVSTAQVSAPTSSRNPASVFPVPSIQSNPGAAAPAAANPQQPAAVGLPTLREGMEGPAVAQLQERLKALGFLQGSIDGVFGTRTQAAVQAAQQNFKLEPDGVVGPATWSALFR